MGLFSKKGLAFEKIKLDKSQIMSDEVTSLKVNVKNFKEKFDNIVVKTNIEDEGNQYLTISASSLSLPNLDFPNSNTGDHEIVITPYNIPVSKMSFKITVGVYVRNNDKPMLKKELVLTVNKRQ
ncbi:hypothetical protein QVH35_11390 [Candidatus Nitrosotenuis chungbukensis]|uniref:hypothetical protein n=1 Tax=Candidatus Nitrosotenuis chungbukensis TaxID=1353246 RepID=UPI0005B2DA90|nr:hypothetical protein [Candidatus Nitrosotenuis chungbukensis]WKT57874.1 hypothetical protein QVH35_11390 [Candidatus Nitrosotenuis chungbukensis]